MIPKIGNNFFRKICRLAVKHWGREQQFQKAVEECGELIVAVQQYKFGRVGEVAVLKEVADVYIMAGQLVDMLDVDGRIMDLIDKKLTRTFLRIKREKKEASK